MKKKLLFLLITSILIISGCNNSIKSEAGKQEYEFSAGSYVAGKDFPPGTYDILAIKDYGDVMVDVEGGDLINLQLTSPGSIAKFIKDNKEDGEPFFHNGEFKNGRFPMNTSLDVKGEKFKIKLIKTKRKKDTVTSPKQKYEFSNGFYVAGEDFPIGSYDIVALEGEGSVTTDAPDDYLDNNQMELQLDRHNVILSLESDSARDKYIKYNKANGETYQSDSYKEFKNAKFIPKALLKVDGDGLKIELTKSKKNNDIATSKKQEYEFPSGLYIAGEDFPAGTYDIEIINGYGSITSKILDLKLMVSDIDIQLESDSSKAEAEDEKYESGYDKKFKNGKFISDTILIVDGKNLKIKLTKSQKTNNIAASPKQEYEFSTGFYVAGEDFPAGTYDIVAVKGYGEIDTKTPDEELQFINDTDIRLESDSSRANPGKRTYETGYDKEFKNGRLTPKTALTVKGNGLKIKLVKSQKSKNIVASPKQEYEFSSGLYVAGEDFPPGTYDIFPIKGKGYVYTSTPEPEEKDTDTADTNTNTDADADADADTYINIEDIPVLEVKPATEAELKALTVTEDEAEDETDAEPEPEPEPEEIKDIDVKLESKSHEEKAIKYNNAKGIEYESDDDDGTEAVKEFRDGRFLPKTILKVKGGGLRVKLVKTK